MSAYGKFTPSRPFRALLAEFFVEDGEDLEDALLIHNECGEAVCAIEQDDSMDVLVQTVIEHECE